MPDPTMPPYTPEALTSIRYLIGEVLTAHAKRVSDADEAVADAQRGVQYAKERYDTSPSPHRRLHEHLGQMEGAVENRLWMRERLDGDPAYLLAVAIRDLLDSVAPLSDDNAQAGERDA